MDFLSIALVLHVFRVLGLPAPLQAFRVKGLGFRVIHLLATLVECTGPEAVLDVACGRSGLTPHSP